MEELETLARSGGGPGWDDLLNGITDYVLVDNGQTLDRIGEEFGEVACRVLAELELAARARFAQRIALVEFMPSLLMQQLAADEISVAEPVIRQSIVLTDSYLIGLAETKHAPYWLAISKRVEVGTRLAHTLLSTRDVDVAHQIAGNSGAAFSDTSVRLLIELAKNDTKLQEVLVHRDDISEANIIQLLPFMAEDLKAQVHPRSGTAEMSLMDSLAEIENDDAKANEGADQRHTDDPGVTENLIEQIEAGRIGASAAVTKQADQNKLDSVSAILANRAGLNSSAVLEAFDDPAGLQLIIICRGVGLDDEAFEAVSYLRSDRLRLPAADIARQRRRFDSLRAPEAIRGLEMLVKRHKAKAGARVA